MSNQEKTEMVLDKVQEFYMADGEGSGEAMFNDFAAKHAEKFTGDYDTPEENDNKLE